MSALAGRSLKIFISYSRKDEAFVDELTLGLTACGFQPFFDRHDIAPGEAWENRLDDLILSADSIVFVMSPDSVASERCEWEAGRAEELRKRIVPVVCRPVGDSDVPKRLGRLNYIFFCGPGFSFARGRVSLSSALKLDLEWIREHTRLTSLAERWKSNGRVQSQLLRGEDVGAATQWMGNTPDDGMEPTALLRDFIEASSLDERERVSAERARDAAIKDAKVRCEAAELLAHNLAAENARLRAEADKERASSKLDASLAGSSGTSEPDTGEIHVGTESLDTLVSPNALELIVAFEVGSRANYETRFSKPVWPGGGSGVSIGIGYDLGYAAKKEIEADWGPVVDKNSLIALLSAQGIKGAPARSVATTLQGIHIPLDDAIGVFKSKTLPRYVRMLRLAVPGATDLPPDSFGALLSIVYNRGMSMGGERRAEMRRIRELVANKEYERVPEQIRSMKRLYPDVKALIARREREAKVFEHGLASANLARPKRLS